MEVLAYIVFTVAILQLLVATTNVVFSQPFLKPTLTTTTPLVSVLIPARNEENNIGKILNDLQNQPYKNIEILVFNDLSTDNTAAIVNQYAQNDQRIKLFNSRQLPKGWLGKNYACYSLAQKATGNYFLFLDADVRIKGNIIDNTVSLSAKHQLGLLSIFPQQIMLTLGENLTVPNMNFILLSLLPLIFVRTSRYPSLAAANGQFMLFDAPTYKKTNPHKFTKNSKVEDIEIARYFKRSKIRIACLSGKSDVKCKMYTGFSDAVNGFSKNVIMFFGNSILTAILFWVITSLGWLFIWLILPGQYLIAYLLILVLTRVFVSVASWQSIAVNLALTIPQQITLFLIIIRALKNNSKKEFKWKGRVIS